MAGGLRSSRSRDIRRWLAGVVAALGVAGAGWLVLFALPNQAALAADLRILHTDYLPASTAQLVRLVSAYLTKSDGVLPVMLGLLVAGGVGAVIGVARRDRLSPETRTLLGAAIGWFVAGAVALLIVTYRQNRYIVPILPALAILVALGWCAATRPASEGSSHDIGVRRRTRPLTLVTGLAAAAVLVAPGGISLAKWAGQPATLPAIQAQVLGMGISTAVQGSLGPLIAMRVSSVLIVSIPKFRINNGDYYATRGVRWVVAAPADPNDVPVWAALHPTAWAERKAQACYLWGDLTRCVYRLP